MKIRINQKELLRVFLGIVFLSAGIFRIFNWQLAVIEFSRFPFGQLNNYLIVFVIALEVIGGLLLLFNKKTKIVLVIFIVFLFLALVQIIATNFHNLLTQSSELFFFEATPTDVFLHFTYLIIIIYLFFDRSITSK